MAYQTGSATDVHGLLDSIRLFALNDGWTINTYSTWSHGYWLNLEKNGVVFNMLSDDSTTEDGGSSKILIRGATSYDGGSAYYDQPGMPYKGEDNYKRWTHAGYVYPPFTAHHFFSGDNYIHVAVEISPNYFRHFGIGQLSKCGTYVGGEYTFGTSDYHYDWKWDEPEDTLTVFPFSCVANACKEFATHVRCMDATSNNNGWLDPYWIDTDYTFIGGYPLKNDSANWQPIQWQFEYSSNSITLAPTPLPIMPIVRIDGGNRGVMGSVKDMRSIDITNLTPGSSIFIGADEWMVFPVTCKTYSGNAIFYSGKYGLAYRKNP